MEDSNSATGNVSSKSWTHNRTTETESKRVHSRHPGNMSIKPPCPYCKSWMNAPDYSKSRVMKTTSVSQGNGNTRSQNIRNHTRKAPETPAQAPHLKYGMFGQRKSAANPKTNEENSKMATKENVSENIEKKDIIPASEPNSPFFSIRALNDKDKSKFSASQTNRGDVELSRLISTASP